MADNDFSSPDGLWFSQASAGLLWLETDDGAYTDVTNCMMLAAVPGQVGDGGKKTIQHARANGGPLNVDTFVGKAPTGGVFCAMPGHWTLSACGVSQRKG